MASTTSDVCRSIPKDRRWTPVNRSAMDTAVKPVLMASQFCRAFQSFRAELCEEHVLFLILVDQALKTSSILIQSLGVVWITLRPQGFWEA